MTETLIPYVALSQPSVPQRLFSLVQGQPYSLEQHPVAVYLARLAPRSRRVQREALDLVAQLLTQGQQDAVQLDWSQLRYPHLQALRSLLAERYAPATANRILAAVRSVLKECWRLGLLDAETLQRCCDTPAVKGERLPTGRSLTLGEITALVHACASTRGPQGVRDIALLALLYTCGLRRSECVALDLAHLDLTESTLIVLGKGNKERRLPIGANGASIAVQRWVQLRGEEPGPLFVRVRKGGKRLNARLTDQAILHILQTRARQAQVKPFSPHDLRRTFITHLLERGVDVALVQKLAGHANVTTTTKYDRRDEQAQRQAVEVLYFPIAR